MHALILNETVSACASSIQKSFIQSDNDSHGQRNPIGEWFRNIISKIMISDVYESFESTLQEQISMLKKIKCLPKKCDYIIDMHLIPRYDKEHSRYLQCGKYKEGTAWFEAYITIQCVNDISRLVLASLHVPTLVFNDYFVRKIITLCTDLDINIGTILLDREFFSTSVLQTIDELGV